MSMHTLVNWTIRAFYIFSSLAIITVRFTPQLRERFLPYGARDVSAQKRAQGAKQPPWSVQLLDYVATWKVPHSWFIHFYIVSVTSSIMGLYLFRPGNNITSTTICGTLMLAQGIRRLLECFLLTSPSQSRMWIGHYAIGIAFYVATNIAIWVERPDENVNRPSGRKGLGESLWTPYTLLCIFLFIYASAKQNQYHRYLAGLPKYTLPDLPIFQTIIAPHYTAECGIYLSLALLRDASQGGLINATLTCALIFVAVNLGVTAEGTRDWMLAKFPERRGEVERRWKMLPPVW